MTSRRRIVVGVVLAVLVVAGLVVQELVPFEGGGRFLYALPVLAFWVILYEVVVSGLFDRGFEWRMSRPPSRTERAIILSFVVFMTLTLLLVTMGMP